MAIAEHSPQFVNTYAIEEHTFPVERVQSRAVVAMDELNRVYRSLTPERSDLWLLQQAVFEARMDALKLMIRDGYQPYGEDRVYIDIRVVREAVSEEAGDISGLPENLTYIRTYTHGGNLW